jgi:carbonic anhydrase
MTTLYLIMKPRPLSFAICSTALLAICGILLADEDKHWSYSGETGPDHWSTLSPEFAACGNGVNQSPIDIRKTIAADLETLQFKYDSDSTEIVNNGHTLQINVGPGSWLRAEGEKFQLIQLHFHSPSEHRIKGEIFPLEGHFVHQNKSGALAVVGVLFRAGEWNTDLAHFGADAPEDLNQPVPIDVDFAALELYHDNEFYYRYNGSLTTPPCTEGIQWYVLKEPGHIAPEQAAQFVNLIGEDARGPQPVNARIVLEK